MVLNGIIQAYRTQIHLTLQGVYAAELRPCEWLIECSYHWKERVYRFSLLYPPSPLRWIPTPSCPEMKGGIKETPQGHADGRNFGIWQGKIKRIADASIKSWFLPCGPFVAYSSPSAVTVGRIQMYIYHPFICNSCTAHKNLMGYIFLVMPCKKIKGQKKMLNNKTK